MLPSSYFCLVIIAPKNNRQARCEINPHFSKNTVLIDQFRVFAFSFWFFGAFYKVLICSIVHNHKLGRVYKLNQTFCELNVEFNFDVSVL